MCESFGDLPDINVRGVESDCREPLTTHFESKRVVVGYLECEVVAVKDHPLVALVDRIVVGRQTSLAWYKHRFCCEKQSCSTGPGSSKRIASPLRVTRQSGQQGRRVQKIAEELDCAWHTVNDGHRGRKHLVLYLARRLLIEAGERLDGHGRANLRDD
jgi:hypothetical protein